MSLLRDLCSRPACSSRGACGPASSSAPASALGPRNVRRSRVAVSQHIQQPRSKPIPSAVPLNYTGPCWEQVPWAGPRRTLVLPERRQVLEQSVHQYYQEVWNTGTTEALESLAEDGVVYSDVLGAACCDVLGRAGLRQLIGDFLAGHPLVKVTLDETVVDEKNNTVVAHWHATAANLLPSRDGRSATGCVSEVSGSDTFRFSERGRISSIASFRERFAGEEACPLDWDEL